MTLSFSPVYSVHNQKSMSKLKLAIQKSGRLDQGSIKLLEDCGIRFKMEPNCLTATSTNFPVELLFLRGADIVKYVDQGIADIGVVGENQLIEEQGKSKIVRQLGFSKCRLSLAVKANESFEGVQDLQGKSIATSYPNSLQVFLNSKDIKAEIKNLSGSVEIAPAMGVADLVCDLVSTGNTLKSNGLKEVLNVLTSEACMIQSPSLNGGQAVLDDLVFRLDAVLKSRSSRYVLMNVPNDRIQAVTRVLPVMKSPTVMPLALEGWSSLHTVIEEQTFWNSIDLLKEAGAEDILVLPLEKRIS